MAMLHNVSNSHTNRGIRSLLKMQLGNIKYITIKSYFIKLLVNKENSISETINITEN